MKFGCILNSVMIENNYKNEIFVLGNEVLINFQDAIFAALEKQLMPRWGLNWFDECVIVEEKAKIKFPKDLQIILKQILFNNNGNFRLALAIEFFKSNKLSKSQLDALANIQICRNLWAHPSDNNMTFTNLQKLSKDIIKFYEGNVNQITEYCTFIMSFKSDDELPIPKILMNSALFKRHLGDIGNIYENVKNYPALESKLINLQSEITKLKAKNPTSNDNQLDDYNTVLHMCIDAMAINHELKMMMSYLSMGSLTRINLKNIQSKKLQKKVKNFETNHIDDVAKEFTTITEMHEEAVELRNSVTGTKHCNCSFCKLVGESGTIGAVTPLQLELFKLNIEIIKHFLTEGEKFE